MNMFLVLTCAVAIFTTSQTVAVTNIPAKSDINHPHGIMSNSDETLTQRINELLKSEAFSRGYDLVTFTVDKGNVTLQGSVLSVSDKSRLERGIRTITGVRSVKSRLVVRNRHTSYNEYGTRIVRMISPEVPLRRL